ncbi:MAG: hypothetical protein J4F97_03125 [Pseudomonadales bacterium]|nr:hypothetical protein [Pseudomonadales bacterium]
MAEGTRRLDRYRIQTFNHIAESGVREFDATNFEVGPTTSDPHAILCRSHRLAASDVPDTLLAIGRAGAGVNNIPVSHCSERGIVVFNTPGANANSVKELVAAALFLSCRDVVGAVQWVRGLSRALKPADLDLLVEAQKRQFAGHELSGRTLGVVGLGAVGAVVARVALDLRMTVLGFDPELAEETARRLSRRVQRVNSLAALFARSDFISLHIPLNRHTFELIGDDLFSICKPGMTLLNFARAEIVEHAAVLRALDSNRVQRYFTDFPHPDFISRESVLATPHLGASTMEATENCAVMAARQLSAFLRKGTITNSVNFPAVSLEAKSGYRIAVANLNEPGMLGALLAVLANRGINVNEMINKSRENLAYNLLDLDVEPDAALLAEIRKVKQVIGVRYVSSPLEGL